MDLQCPKCGVTLKEERIQQHSTRIQCPVCHAFFGMNEAAHRPQQNDVIDVRAEVISTGSDTPDETTPVEPLQEQCRDNGAGERKIRDNPYTYFSRHKVVRQEGCGCGGCGCLVLLFVLLSLLLRCSTIL
ncbi:MAG: hypothetical protein KAH38_10570 [Candidatus Hydrogenedentes bacterium]|nr:hypothetical protein [Candidatus Hydrogenedentota bacterium]